MKSSYTIYIDWDIDYKQKKAYYKYLAEAINFIQKKYGLILIKLMARKSASGNTHIAIVLDKKPDFLTEIMIRTLARDDVYRVAMDIMRYAKSSRKETNRIFDVKFSKNKIKKAGKWHLLNRSNML
jgi:hypothetical protein